MPVFVLLALSALLAAPGPATAGPAPRAPVRSWPRAASAGPGRAVAGLPPATSRRPAAADTTRRPALVPDPATGPAAADDDSDKPTRKATLLTLLAVALLTFLTLLLYNVRSR